MTDTTTDWERRVMATDWHDIPRGHYAIAVYDDDDEDYTLLGYKLFERKVPQTYKNGRTVGCDGWKRSYALAPGTTPSRAAFDKLRENALDDTEFCRRCDIDSLLSDLDWHREEFGRLTGRCGCCGKTLTDPDSKMRGIGPECIKGLR
ncbi:DUF6011 domain-containing protein [Mycobacterium sp.]|uniref:DUF6011 domain-containing protein n=1 Tax=Mycobacterium sp. TaxID=1785 RepID=UPI002BA2436E|nr:DUF6011 domain-containing protein [Mycobacterium sp.]HTY35131.1 DUF6011 domain-containing protein [Mycobacterium sp.]